MISGFLFIGMCAALLFVPYAAIRFLVEPLEVRRTKYAGEPLTPQETKDVSNSHCPDCQSDLKLSAESGICMNLHCTSDGCGSRFNAAGPFGMERLTDAGVMGRVRPATKLTDARPYRGHDPK